MSVLNKKPFIQSLIESLSSSEKSTLLGCLNGSGTKVKYSLALRNLTVTTPIEPVLLETKTQLFNGYKIYKSGSLTFLMYGQGQEMSIYHVSYPYYEKELKGRIREELDIDELRRYLEEVGSSVVSGEIDSGNATSGQVLTADGSSGAEWTTPFLSSITPVTTATQLTVLEGDGENVYTAGITFTLTKAIYDRISASKLLIFTMNNSFVVTPLLQTGMARSCGSFVYDDSGNSVVARLLIQLNEEDGYKLIVQFDNTFAGLAHEGFTTLPSGLVLIAE